MSSDANEAKHESRSMTVAEKRKHGSSGIEKAWLWQRRESMTVTRTVTSYTLSSFRNRRVKTCKT